jgi:hypothetical protein
MQVTTRTATVHHHFIDIDGVEYGTTFQADEYIEPKIETEGNKTVLTYAAHDEFPFNPRESYAAGTMVRVRDGYGGMDIDQPDSDIESLFEVCESLAAWHHLSEVYFIERCGCWNGHDLTEVEAGECDQSYEALLVAGENDTFQDGSSYGLELPLDGAGDLESSEGIAALLEAWQERGPFTSQYDLMKAYLKVGRPDITAFQEWSITGYSQGDWAEGYIYTTVDDFTDPEAAMKAEVAEYGAWANGDVYLLVQETYIDNEQTDYDVIGGFYGEDAIEAAIKDGGHF